jgi:hypothetical protein
MTDNIADKDSDLFSAIKKAHGALPAGEYKAELLSVLPYQTAKTRGATAHIRIVEGAYRGRQIELRFLEAGPSSQFFDNLIARDATALSAWFDAVVTDGRRPAFKDGIYGALKMIWSAGKGETVLLTIGVTMTRAGLPDMHLTGARADDSGI